MAEQSVAETSGEVRGQTWHVAQQTCHELLDSVESGSVDLVIADPPYNLGLKYQDYNDNLKPQEFLAWCDEWLYKVWKVLKADGSAYIFMGEKYASEIDVLCKRIGLYKRSRIVWYYTFGQAAAKGWTPSHVSIFYYTKHPKKFVFNKEDPELRVPSARQLVYKDKRANQAGKLPDDTWMLLAEQYDQLLRYDDDLWHQSRVCGTFKVKAEGMPCQLPSAVTQRIIRASSNPSSKILDPFCGSGQIMYDALLLGRSAVTCDVSPACVQYAIDRMSKLV